jgi:hypothetical protein
MRDAIMAGYVVDDRLYRAETNFQVVACPGSTTRRRNTT